MPAPRFQAVLLDLSGTLHIDRSVIDGAVSAVHRLRAAGKRVRFLSNTSKQSSQALLEQLVEFGFLDADDHGNASVDNPQHYQDSLITSVLATRNYLVKHRLRPYCIMEDTSDFGRANIPLDPPHTAVVIGLSPNHCNYSNLNKAFQILLDHPERPLIAIHKGKYYRGDGQQLCLGPGPFVAGLEMALDRPAIVMGKPSREFFASALFPDVSPAETVMIGDDALQDVQGAVDAGMGTCILVRTVEAVAYLLGDKKDAEVDT